MPCLLKYAKFEIIFVSNVNFAIFNPLVVALLRWVESLWPRATSGVNHWKLLTSMDVLCDEIDGDD